MARSVKKGPFVDLHLVKKVQAMATSGEKRVVKTGQRRVGSVEVVAGLAAGDMIVIEGTQKLRDGAPVSPREAPQPAQASTTEPAERS